MLKISEMAKLANTTRRTLIFYDEEKIFQPKERSAAGYRYYDYDQLYDLLFILGLTKLGISLKKVKQLQTTKDTEVVDELLNVQENISGKIDELSKIRTVVAQKLNQETDDKLDLYQPIMIQRPCVEFWCSKASVSCTEEEVAELFSDFYQQLDSLALMDGSQSGFLTDLPDSQAKLYPDAGFRVIKESTTNNSGKAMPKIEKPAGKYVVIKVESTTSGICKGLEKLHDFCRKNNYQITADLWQMNSGDDVLAEHGGTEFSRLEYFVKEA
ncbi:MerR family transcriptional regulator [Companilactobacillus nantensis]|nr:MerR family transcriptional regulator [Companilactobacillus nantensis]GEO65361.1 MerR family transcriptional regulator [Companilactobacillus nantensis]